MATGYTSDITETTTLNEFIMRCARAFGALIEMRDEPLDAPIPEEFKARGYHSDALKEAKEKLFALKALTSSQVIEACNKNNKSSLEYWQKSRNERNALKKNYTRILKMVRKWKPPTEDHVEMKNFMISQLTDSIKWDCSGHPKPKTLTPTKWLKVQIESANWDIEYHGKHQIEDEARAAERSNWVKALRESLK